MPAGPGAGCQVIREAGHGGVDHLVGEAGDAGDAGPDLRPRYASGRRHQAWQKPSMQSWGTGRTSTVPPPSAAAISSGVGVLASSSTIDGRYSAHQPLLAVHLGVEREDDDGAVGDPSDLLEAGARVGPVVHRQRRQCAVERAVANGSAPARPRTTGALATGR